MSNGYSTTVYPNGVTNAPIGTALQTFGAPDPTVMHMYFNDFDVYTAGDWTVTGSPASAGIVTGDGGWLAVVNTTALNDQGELRGPQSFAITAGREAWFKVRFKVSSATNAAFTIGLIQNTVTPLTVTNGIYLSKAAATTTVTGKITSASVTSTVNLGAMADDTFVTLGWHYDGRSLVQFYLNGNRVGSVPATTLPAGALVLTLAAANGTAAAITATYDYVLASTERPSTAL